ncbi:hypothetical protein HOR51_gp15 [Ralstonia phage phiAp1]|uniref:Uncharacterized protein n=1 Tax=Ralstonia phage phiAp1 TaxID=2783867 RepID=A0A1L7DS51_9CAUD|nr:hypothetical protein HOR51_gp15 [Ralstonia phage phiAp1]APU03156.1 hypothetical protein phiAp1_15 [Ralstonia phage phiAp1]
MFGLRSIGKSLANALSHVATKGEVKAIDDKLSAIVAAQPKVSISDIEATEREPKAAPLNRAARRKLYRARGKTGPRIRSTRAHAFHNKRGNKLDKHGMLTMPGKQTHDFTADKHWHSVDNRFVFGIIAATPRTLTKKEIKEGAQA